MTTNSVVDRYAAIGERVEHVHVTYYDGTFSKYNAVLGHPTLIHGILRGVFLDLELGRVYEVVAVSPGSLMGYAPDHMAIYVRDKTGVSGTWRLDLFMPGGEHADYKIIPRPTDWPWSPPMVVIQ